MLFNNGIIKIQQLTNYVTFYYVYIMVQKNVLVQILYLLYLKNWDFQIFVEFIELI